MIRIIPWLLLVLVLAADGFLYQRYVQARTRFHEVQKELEQTRAATAEIARLPNNSHRELPRLQELEREMKRLQAEIVKLQEEEKSLASSATAPAKKTIELPPFPVEPAPTQTP